LRAVTFGKLSEAIAKDTIHKGIRISNEERFKTSHMEFYADPKVVKMPVYEPAEKKSIGDANSVDIVKKDKPIPEEHIYKFWGVEHKGDIYEVQ